MSVPCGFDAGGLPVGLHLVGNYFDEARMLDIAHRYQQRPTGIPGARRE